jgi:diguanylate cyclase (GGDEF)-like protein
MATRGCGKMPHATLARPEREPMPTETVTVLLVGLDDAVAQELGREDGFTVVRADLPHGEGAPDSIDAVVLELDGSGPLDKVREVRAVAPSAALVVVTDAEHAADGTIAVHAGAEDHLILGSTLPGLLPHTVRHAVGMRRLRRELATTDEATGVPNLRGFVAIAEHHLRMADRNGSPVVLIFVRLDDHAEILRTVGPAEADALARDVASVILEAVRRSDVPARISAETFVVLLTGDAAGAEPIVLSRLVEAMAMHDARVDRPHQLGLSVGSARYEPGSGTDLAEILGSAARGLSPRTGDSL